MSNRLALFFAVTRGEFSVSVHRVEWLEEPPTPVRVTKTYRGGVGDDSPPVGSELKGDWVWIGKILGVINTFQMDTISFGQMEDSILQQKWLVKEHTASVVALFQTEGEALECAGNAGLNTPDDAWKNETLQVLRRIGPNHPVFLITCNPKLRLFSD